MTDATESHVFIVLFQIPDATDPDEYAVRLYSDDGIDDVSLIGPDAAGVFEVDCERVGPSFSAAVLGVVRDLERVFPEATILRVEPDDLVTIAAIAERVGRSHESVRLLARGERGPGGFPVSAGRLDAKTQVWRWMEVAQWFEASIGPLPGGEHAAFLAAVNDILDLRRVAGAAIDAPATAEALAALLPEQLTSAAQAAV
jgi:hypothetical protein